MHGEIERDVRAFITDNFLLLEAGLIDSMGILELVAFLEGRFGLHVADSEIVPANMDSVRSIAGYVTGKLAVANAA